MVKKCIHVFVSSVCLIFFAYMLWWFCLPIDSGIKNIGNLTGIILSLLGIMLSLFHTFIFKFIKYLWKRIYGKIIIVAVTLALTTICIFAIIITICMNRATRNKPSTPVTLVVLGCRVYGTTPSLMLTERLDAAYDYLINNRDAVCILSGGKGDGENISESDCMYKYLTEKGISKDRLFKEDKSTSTRENIEFSLEIIKANDLNPKIGIVTNEFHQYRASKIAEKHGIEAYAVNGKTAWWLFPTFYIREMWGIMYEWFL